MKKLCDRGVQVSEDKYTPDMFKVIIPDLRSFQDDLKVIKDATIKKINGRPSLVFMVYRILCGLDKQKTFATSYGKAKARAAINFIDVNLESSNPRFWHQTHDDMAASASFVEKKRVPLVEDDVISGAMGLIKLHNVKPEDILIISKSGNMQVKAANKNLSVIDPASLKNILED